MSTDGRRSREEEEVPLWLEAGSVGGVAAVGLAIYFWPQMKEPVLNLLERAAEPIRRGWKTVVIRTEPLRRRRRNGSLVRVIAYLLPTCVFPKPQRVYIMGLSGDPEVMRGGLLFEDRNEAMDSLRMLNSSDEDGAEIGTVGLMVAFEIQDEDDDTEIVDSETVFEEDTEENDDEWVEQTEVFPFQPRANSTAYQCSTPAPEISQLPDLCRRNTEIISDLSAAGDQTRQPVLRKNDNETERLAAEVLRLTSTVELLLQKVQEQQEQSRLTSASSISESLLPVPSTAINVHTNHTGERSCPIPPPPPMFQSAAPPPPPPPPPPGLLNQPISTIKIKSKESANNDSSKRSTPNAPSVDALVAEIRSGTHQLRKVPRSPGGTPIKQTKKSDGRNDLEKALKKRWEAWGPCSEDDDESKENDMNTSNDWAESPRQNRSILTPRNENETRRKSLGKPSPAKVQFGQHMLKRRIPTAAAPAE